jgi:hypothetical protein
MTVYGSEEAAFRRVDTLKQSGIWPGVRRVFGGWELTCDPDVRADRAADGLLGPGAHPQGVIRYPPTKRQPRGAL